MKQKNSSSPSYWPSGDNENIGDTESFGSPQLAQIQQQQQLQKKAMKTIAEDKSAHDSLTTNDVARFEDDGRALLLENNTNDANNNNIGNNNIQAEEEAEESDLMGVVHHHHKQRLLRNFDIEEKEAEEEEGEVEAHIPLVAGSYGDRTEVELRISCQDLPSDLEVVFRCFCVVYISTPEDDNNNGIEYSSSNKKAESRDDVEGKGNCRSTSILSKLPSNRFELGKTEIVSHPNPEFVTSFIHSFMMDKLHDVTILVYSKREGRSHNNNDNNNNNAIDQHVVKDLFLGGGTFRMERVIRSAGGCQSHHLELGGIVTLNVMPTHTDCRQLTFRLSAMNLKTRGSIFKGKRNPNPFFIVSYLRKSSSNNNHHLHLDHDEEPGIQTPSRQQQQQHSSSSSNEVYTWIKLWKSEIIHGTTVPQFHCATAQLSRLNGGDQDTEILFSMLDYNEKTKQNKVIGYVKTNVRELLSQNKFDLLSNNRIAGTVIIEHADVYEIPSMVDYIIGGECSIDFMVGIDFTQTNEVVKENRVFSLHTLSRDGRLRNPYQQVLHCVGQLFEEYSNSETIHMWGYGAEYDGSVRQRFRMGAGGCVVGAHGLMKAYSRIVRLQAHSRHVRLSGPKDLRPILEAAMDRAEKTPLYSKQRYSILLLIAPDGQIHELNDLLEIICESSRLPMSIIFVGVGDGEFEDMKEIEANSDSMMLLSSSSSGNEFARRNVHFVPLKKYIHDPTRLTRRIMERIPNHLVQYFLCRGIFPPTEVPGSRPSALNDSSVISDLSWPQSYGSKSLLSSGKSGSSGSAKQKKKKKQSEGMHSI